jgi:hypothetical protein
MSEGSIPVNAADDKPEPPPSRLGDDGGPALQGERHEDGSYDSGPGAASNDAGAVLQEAFGGDRDFDGQVASADAADDEPSGDEADAGDEGADPDEPAEGSSDFTDSATDEVSDDEPGVTDDESTDDGASDDEPDVGAEDGFDADGGDTDPDDQAGDDFDAAPAE